MTFEEAKRSCHVRAAIFRKSNPSKKYWKNSFDFQNMTENEKQGNDWEEYDPAEHEPPYYLMA